MELTLKRKDLNANRTIGELYIDDAMIPECRTLEDTVRPDGVKVPGATAIPAGRYRVTVTYSNRFKRNLALLNDVPNFEGIRIHAGNSAKDTEGCILVGRQQNGDTVVESRYALSVLQPKIERAIDRGEQVWITILNP